MQSKKRRPDWELSNEFTEQLGRNRRGKGKSSVWNLNALMGTEINAKRKNLCSVD
jgi:hypothetical protein